MERGKMNSLHEGQGGDVHWVIRGWDGSAALPRVSGLHRKRGLRDWEREEGGDGAWRWIKSRVTSMILTH